MLPAQFDNLLVKLACIAETMTGKDEQKKSLDFNNFDFARGSDHTPVFSTIPHQNPYPRPFTGGQKVRIFPIEDHRK